MANVLLTPEEKNNYAKRAEYQRLFITAVLEESRAYVEDFFVVAPIGDLKEWKLDGMHRQFLVSNSEVRNLEGKIVSHFTPYTDTDFIVEDTQGKIEVDSTLVTIKVHLSTWYLLQGRVDPGDQTISGTKDPVTGEWAPTP